MCVFPGKHSFNLNSHPSLPHRINRERHFVHCICFSAHTELYILSRSYVVLFPLLLLIRSMKTNLFIVFYVCLPLKFTEIFSNHFNMWHRHRTNSNPSNFQHKIQKQFVFFFDLIFSITKYLPAYCFVIILNTIENEETKHVCVCACGCVRRNEHVYSLNQIHTNYTHTELPVTYK